MTAAQFEHAVFLNLEPDEIACLERDHTDDNFEPNCSCGYLDHQAEVERERERGIAGAASLAMVTKEKR